MNKAPHRTVASLEAEPNPIGDAAGRSLTRRRILDANRIEAGTAAQGRDKARVRIGGGAAIARRLIAISGDGACAPGQQGPGPGRGEHRAGHLCAQTDEASAAALLTSGRVVRGDDSGDVVNRMSHRWPPSHGRLGARTSVRTDALFYLLLDRRRTRHSGLGFRGRKRPGNSRRKGTITLTIPVRDGRSLGWSRTVGRSCRISLPPGVARRPRRGRAHVTQIGPGELGCRPSSRTVLPANMISIAIDVRFGPFQATS